MSRLAALALGFLLVVPALAHDGSTQLDEWYRSLKTYTGQSCCSWADCEPVDAKLVGDHYEARVGARWISVPPDRVIRRDNPTGSPVLCRERVAGTVLCFIPSSET